MRHPRVLLAASAPKLKTVTFQVAWGKEILTYDPARVSLADLEHWMRLSPRGDSKTWGSDTSTLVPPLAAEFQARGRGRAWCRQNAGRGPFGPDVPANQIRGRIRWLDRHNYPPGLKPVVLYLRNVQLYGLWLYNQTLAYAQTCDLTRLEGTYNNIDLGVSCREAVDRIRNPGSGINDVALAHSAWWGCAWAAWHKQYGQYPNEAWYCFMAAHGVQMRYVYLGY